MKKIFLLGLVSLLLIGCATISVISPEYKEKYATKIYNIDYDKLFDITLNVFESLGFPILEIDKSNGLIITEEKRIFIFINEFRQKIYAHFTKIEQSSTKLRLTLFLNNKETAFKGDYQTIFDTIDKKLGIQ